MFTGLVTHVAEVIRVADTAAGREFTLASPWTDVAHGESIAVDGVCLTVRTVRAEEFSVAAVGTTVSRTTLAHWAPGRQVNLERALRAGDRLGGHLVQGHIDGAGAITAARMDGDAWVLDVALGDGAEGLCVPQGSITIDGVSLTISAMASPRAISVAIIEYTRTLTTLGERRAGDDVNVEFDLIGKYVRQQLAPWNATL